MGGAIGWFVEGGGVTFIGGKKHVPGGNTWVRIKGRRNTS